MLNALAATIPGEVERPNLLSLPPRHNPDQFRVRIRDLPARTVAYILVAKPYEGDAVLKAVERLMSWAQRHGCADSQWLGYQWDNPEITSLKDCRYYVAVVAQDFVPKGEIGRFQFPSMVIGEVEIRGDINLELRPCNGFMARGCLVVATCRTINRPSRRGSAGPSRMDSRRLRCGLSCRFAGNEESLNSEDK